MPVSSTDRRSGIDQVGAADFPSKELRDVCKPLPFRSRARCRRQFFFDQPSYDWILQRKQPQKRCRRFSLHRFLFHD